MTIEVEPSIEVGTLGAELAELFRRHGIAEDEYILSACIDATTATLRVTVRDDERRIMGPGHELVMVERQIALSHRAPA